MKERYELIEASGSDGEIHHAKIAIHFEEGDNVVTNYSGGPLPASVDADSDHDVIIHSALNALGARQLKDIRDEAKNKLSIAGDTNTVYFSSKNNEVERCYVRLALLETNQWDDFKRYFDHSSDVTPTQRTMFEDAPVWKKNNTAIRHALGDEDDVIDRAFTRACELAKQANYMDVFDD